MATSALSSRRQTTPPSSRNSSPHPDAEAQGSGPPTPKDEKQKRRQPPRHQFIWPPPTNPKKSVTIGFPLTECLFAVIAPTQVMKHGDGVYQEP